ncbi:hypothetical protein Anas_12756 [Armadillidium nasatum]|uniref:WAP domain-containing protein n=1 Tax=Armadillidium nasatum TaxID=96803 RepID=A0A5N5T544_9CRUS|nr:hypothetical protein Anas_12756 [Armadillidium nasatum]
MKFLFCGLCVFLFVFLLNFNAVSSILLLNRFIVCYPLLEHCPPDYKPPPSCLFKTCPPGEYCCFDGCSHKCSHYRKKPSDPYD